MDMSALLRAWEKERTYEGDFIAFDNSAGHGSHRIGRRGGGRSQDAREC
jgi:hypothetical protein